MTGEEIGLAFVTACTIFVAIITVLIILRAPRAIGKAVEDA